MNGKSTSVTFSLFCYYNHFDAPPLFVFPSMVVQVDKVG